MEFPVNFDEVFKVWQKEWVGSPDKRVIGERQAALEECSYEHHKLWGSMLEWVQDGKAGSVRRFLSPFSDNLSPVVDVVTLSPERLLRFAATEGDGPIARCTRFESIQLFDIAAAMTLAEIEMPRVEVDKKRDAFVDLITTSLFRPGERVVPVYSYHWPTKGYEVDVIGFGRDIRPHSRYKRHMEYVCRVLNDGTPVFFFHRVKGRWDSYLKRQRQLDDPTKENPYVVLDACGLTFVVETQAQVRKLVRELIRVVEQANGFVAFRENNLSGNGRMDRTNHESSPKFRAAKYEAWFEGQCFEILIMVFRDYISSKYALTRENHELYRVSQWHNRYAPLIFPYEVYGIDWGNKRVQKRLRACKVHELGWHVDPDNV